MRVPSFSASWKSWVMNRMVLCKQLLQRQQLVLHLAADQRIERAERLVHDHQVGIGISARARPTRWRMPPLKLLGR